MQVHLYLLISEWVYLDSQPIPVYWLMLEQMETWPNAHSKLFDHYYVQSQWREKLQRDILRFPKKGSIKSVRRQSIIDAKPEGNPGEIPGPERLWSQREMWAQELLWLLWRLRLKEDKIDTNGKRPPADGLCVFQLLDKLRFFWKLFYLFFLNLS